MVPTLWIVLGPVGQSITAVNLLATNAFHRRRREHDPTRYSSSLSYTVSRCSAFALLWTVIALAITIRTARGAPPVQPDLVVFHLTRGTLRQTGLNGTPPSTPGSPLLGPSP